MYTPAVITVSQLNMYIKSVLDGDMNLNSVFVSGEISNFTNHYRTGHYYMTLKDEKAAVKAVMFKTANMRLKFMPENGMHVIALGRISVFERDGQYQLYIEDMQPDGIGALNVAFEQLKSKLEQEGLFLAENKKEIPQMPERIGVITSPTGAAVRDILSILDRRFPLAEVIFCPVEVQGVNAAPSMVKALESFDKAKCADVIIIGRGGGSLEELWAFNEESLARAVYHCSIPVISAVGHETDYTICDFAADLRAPTPSAAAELAVPDYREHMAYLESAKRLLFASVTQYLAEQKKNIEALTSSSAFLSPKDKIAQDRQNLDMLSSALKHTMEEFISDRRLELAHLCDKADALSPLKILSRGYSVVFKDEKILSDTTNAQIGDSLAIKLNNGTLECEVTGIGEHA